MVFFTKMMELDIPIASINHAVIIFEGELSDLIVVYEKAISAKHFEKNISILKEHC